MKSLFFLPLLLLLVVVAVFIITTYHYSSQVTATSEPTPFEADLDYDEEDNNDETSSIPPHEHIDGSRGSDTTVHDLIQKHIGHVIKSHSKVPGANHFQYEQEDHVYDTNFLKVPGHGRKRKITKPPQDPDFRRRKRVQSNHVCPDETAPKIGDRVTLHIPSREHLVPRFTGMRVFAPPHAEYHEDQNSGFRNTKHVVDHHWNAKLLYVFDEHVIQGVWPVHAGTIYGSHRNLKVLVKDVHVQEDPNDKEGGELCYFKVSVE